MDPWWYDVVKMEQWNLIYVTTFMEKGAIIIYWFG